MSITINQTVVKVLLSVNEDTQVVNVSVTPMAVSIPTGGLEGQVLAKNSDANYDFKWVTALVIEEAATFADISPSTAKRFIQVEEDETNDGEATLYYHNGTVLNWVVTQQA